MQNQSGRLKGKTALSKIGNALLRKALFMPASVAARYCAPIKLWAQQIQSRRPEFSNFKSGVPSCTSFSASSSVCSNIALPSIPNLPLLPIKLDSKDRIFGAQRIHWRQLKQALSYPGCSSFRKTGAAAIQYKHGKKNPSVNDLARGLRQL
jgi:hypothetical protein